MNFNDAGHCDPGWYCIRIQTVDYRKRRPVPGLLELKDGAVMRITGLIDVVRENFSAQPGELNLSVLDREPVVGVSLIGDDDIAVYCACHDMPSCGLVQDRSAP